MKSRQGTLSSKMLNQERQSYGKQSERAVTLTLTTSRKYAQPPNPSQLRNYKPAVGHSAWRTPSMKPMASSPLLAEGKEDVATGLEATAQATLAGSDAASHAAPRQLRSKTTFMLSKLSLTASFTFISAELNVRKQANLNDLPEKPKNQVGFPFPQVLCTNIDNMATDGRCRIQRQVQVLLWTAQSSETQPREMSFIQCQQSRDFPLVLAPTSAAWRKLPQLPTVVEALMELAQ